MNVKKICAWCKKDIEIPVLEIEKGNSILDSSYQNKAENQEITHGLCDECSAMLLLSPVKLEKLINKIKIPILVIDENRIVLGANDKALSLLSKDLNTIKGSLTGDVMQCINSEEPEGCGNTIHCSGCAIKRAINLTHNSGKSIKHQKSYHFISTLKGVQKTYIEISTEKVNDIVFLRVDNMKPDEEIKSKSDGEIMI